MNAAGVMLHEGFGTFCGFGPLSRRRSSDEPASCHAGEQDDAQQGAVDHERPGSEPLQNPHQAPNGEECRDRRDHEAKREDGPAVRIEWALWSSHSSFSPAKAMAGSPRRNEKRAASSRWNPSASAAVSVEPERETPGISAPTWATPTSSALSCWAEPVQRLQSFQP